MCTLLNKVPRAVAFGALALAASLAASMAHAQEAVDSEITMVKADGVLISDVDDWMVGIFGPNDTIARRQGNFDYICVYSSSGLYRLDVSSANGGANLTLRSGAGDPMEYLIVSYSYSDTATRAFPDDREEFEQPFSLTRRLASPSTSCVGQGFGDANLYLAAAINPADFNAAPPGIYQDTVIMTVSAE